MNARGRRWRPTFSPQASWATVAPGDTQAALRGAFGRWGRPARFRVDNGTPWGSSGDLPPDLALWLLGLGIDLIWNAARRPEQNGVVERSQGTGKRWAEPWACDTPAQLQARLEELDAILREEYPSVQGRSRRDAFPGLAHSGRPYGAGWERRHWDLGRVLAAVAEHVLVRRVDRKGMVSLYNRTRYVGTAHRGRDVYVTLDPERCEWVFVDLDHNQLRVQPAEELTRARIVGLTVTHRR